MSRNLKRFRRFTRRRVGWWRGVSLENYRFADKRVYKLRASWLRDFLQLKVKLTVNFNCTFIRPRSMQFKRDAISRFSFVLNFLNNKVLREGNKKKFLNSQTGFSLHLCNAEQRSSVSAFYSVSLTEIQRRPRTKNKQTLAFAQGERNWNALYDVFPTIAQTAVFVLFNWKNERIEVCDGERDWKLREGGCSCSRAVRSKHIDSLIRLVKLFVIILCSDIVSITQIQHPRFTILAALLER